MYPFSKYLGLKGVPMWVLEGLSTYYMGTWSLWGSAELSVSASLHHDFILGRLWGLSLRISFKLKLPYY